MLPLLALLLTTPSQACLCNPGPRLPCEKNMSAEIAFTGHVLDIQRTIIDDTGHLQVRMRIDEAFKGVTGKEAIVHTRETSCGFPFALNASYLVRAWRGDNGEITAGACSRSLPLESAAEDIENLRHLTSTNGPVKVYGFATATPSDVQFGYRAAVPTANLSITLQSGERQWQTTTDDKGEYAFTGIPPGDFQLTANLTNLPGQQRTRSFTLKSGECRSANFITVPMASISGRLLDAGGHPVASMVLDIFGVPPTPDPKYFSRVSSDRQGRFRFEHLPMGTYILASPHTNVYPRTFYPNASGRSNAQPIVLKNSESIENLEFRLLPITQPMPY